VAIDFWKMLAILGVVWIHCSYVIPHQPTLFQNVSPAFRFCVPVFILFWAYFAESSALRPDWSWRRSLWRARSLVFAFLFWSLVYWGFKGDLRSPVLQQITRYWSGYGWPGQYFFIVLLQAIAAFPFLRWLSDKVPPRLNLLGTIALLAATSLLPEPAGFLAKVGDRILPYWIPYCLAGIHLARGVLVLPRIHWSVALAAAAAIPAAERLVPGRLGAIGPYLHAGVALAGFAIGASAVQGGCPSLVRAGVAARAVTGVSRRTFAIFCLNPMFLVLADHATAAWRPVGFAGAGVLVPSATAVAIVVLSMLAASGLERIGLGFAVRN